MSSGFNCLWRTYAAEILNSNPGSTCKMSVDSMPDGILKGWSRAYFTTDKACDAVENGISECFNALIVDDRRKPIINMLEDIRLLCMDRSQRMREKHEKWNDGICPNIKKKLEKCKDDHMTQSKELPTKTEGGHKGVEKGCAGVTGTWVKDVMQVFGNVCAGWLVKLLGVGSVTAKGEGGLLMQRLLGQLSSRGEGMDPSQGCILIGIRPNRDFGVPGIQLIGQTMLGHHPPVESQEQEEAHNAENNQYKETTMCKKQPVQRETSAVPTQTIVARKSERIAQILFNKPQPGTWIGDHDDAFSNRVMGLCGLRLACQTVRNFVMCIIHLMW
ncbi:hypothetical protein Tco_0134602 [Tanacetum coccineum]